MKALRLTVIGGGSVGMGIAASFAIGGAWATLLIRAASMEVLRTQGIRVTGVLGNHTIPPGLIYIDDADSANSSSLDCDVVVVATKAYQVDGRRSLAGGSICLLSLCTFWGSNLRRIGSALRDKGTKYVFSFDPTAPNHVCDKKTHSVANPLDSNDSNSASAAGFPPD